VYYNYLDNPLLRKEKKEKREKRTKINETFSTLLEYKNRATETVQSLSNGIMREMKKYTR